MEGVHINKDKDKEEYFCIVKNLKIYLDKFSDDGCLVGICKKDDKKSIYPPILRFFDKPLRINISIRGNDNIYITDQKVINSFNKIKEKMLSE